METAQHVENMPDSSINLTFDEIKNQCEALVTGKQHRMSVLQSFKEHSPVGSNYVRIHIPLANIFLSKLDR